jgi:hypothetical protein
MKTLQRQNTKREIVKKVRFQKNEVVKGSSSQLQKLSHFSSNVPIVPVVPVVPVVPANFESSGSELGSNVVERTDEDQNKDENNEQNKDNEENKGVDAITLSLVE